MEKIYTSDGKVFQREFQKFGDICLTQTNERIFVCNHCAKLWMTPTQFWKHQRDEHGIRDFQDAVDNPQYQTDKKQLLAIEKQNNGNSSCLSIKTRSSDKLLNGSPPLTERKSVGNHEKNDLVSELTSVKQNDSPLLKKALKEPPRLTKAAEIIPSANQEQLDGVLNCSSHDENFNEFIYFCCPECGVRFQTDVEWKQHTAAAHNYFAADQLNMSLYKVNPDGTKVYKCDICHVLLNKPNIGPLRRHKLTHMPFKSFCCRLCGAAIRHKSGIVHHMRTVHRKGRDKLFKCEECRKSFYSLLQYRKHFRLHPGKGKPCAGLDMSDVFFSPELLDTATDDIVGFFNEISEDCNYENCTNINITTDNDYDPSAFLVTELLEDEDAQDDEMFVHTFEERIIKEEPAAEIMATPEAYTMLWQEDAALIAEQQIHRAIYQQMSDAGGQSTKETISPPTSKFECVVCCKSFASKPTLEKHLRSHGKKMDCRHCGVKISSLKALRRHRDLNRCKVLMSQNAVQNGKKDAAKINRNLRSTKEVDTTNTWNDNVQGKADQFKDDVSDKAASKPPIVVTFNCEICDEKHETVISLSLHGARAHRETDCRLCGVKISTVGSLRRHYELKRCKALN